MIHQLFSFTSSESQVVFVRYDDALDQVGAFNNQGGPLDAGPQQHSYVGQAVTAAGKTFMGINVYPYAEESAAQHPSDGTFLRNDCNGLDLQQVLADGVGGERWGNVVEYNSATCGYVPPAEEPVLGCTDPTADNYNPLATEGNPNENACTYTPGVLSEVKVIEVRSCPGDGVHLQWYNNLGGVDAWYFQGKVDTLFASEPTSEYNYANGLKSAAGKVLTPSMVVNTSELNYNRFQAICQIFSSPLVWMNKDGEQVQVYVEPASDLGQRNIGQSSYSLQVRVSLQPLNALRN